MGAADGKSRRKTKRSARKALEEDDIGFGSETESSKLVAFKEEHDTALAWGDVSSGRIERAVDFDFDAMRIGDVVVGDEAIVEVQKVVFDHFASIAKLITYYGGLARGSFPRVGFTECAHILHCSGVLRLGDDGSADDAEAFESAFARVVNKNVARGANPRARSDHTAAAAA